MEFMKPDKAPAISMIIKISRASPLPARRRMRCPIDPATPVRAKPALRINTAQTVTTAALLKPDSASTGVRIPVRAKLTITSRATRSIRTRSVIKRMTASAVMAKTVAISKVMWIPILVRGC